MKNIKEEDKTLLMLIGDVHRQFGHRIREEEKNNGLNSCVGCILFELSKNSNLTQIELVNKIHMRPSSISVALQKMENDGLIERYYKDDDKRYSKVNITSKGLELCVQMKNNIHELDNSLTKEIKQEELEITKKVLREISKKIMEGHE